MSFSKWSVLTALSLAMISGAGAAQTPTSFSPYQPLTAAQLNSAFLNKLDWIGTAPVYPGANSSITSLTGLTTPLTVGQGGTGESLYVDGQLLIGDTSSGALDKATISGGTGIAVGNGHGSITVSATGVFTGAITTPAITWPSYGVLETNANGSFTYSTQAYGVSTSPYQNNLAMGDHALNPTTHFSTSHCFLPNSGFTGFCGDNVAYGAFALAADVWGRDNTAIGDHAASHNISGNSITAVGSSAAANIQTSGLVDAFGVSACQNATDFAGPITCLGQQSLEIAGNSSANALAVGFQAGISAVDIENSVILGGGVASSTPTIIDSVVVGDHGCDKVTVSITSSICIGFDNGPSATSMTNTLWISAPGTATPLLYGNLATGVLGVGTTTLTAGAALTVGTGGVAMTGFMRPGGGLFANLSAIDPTPQVGDQLVITDAAACVANVAVAAGGGSTHSCLVAYNGASWVAVVTH